MYSKTHKKLLRSYNLNQDLFDKVLREYKDDIVIVDDIYEYFHGSVNVGKIYLNASKTIMIVRETSLFIAMGKESDGIPAYMQVRVERVSDKLGEDIEADISGSYAYNYMIRMLKKYYSSDEIDRCLLSHTATHDENLVQEHFETMIKKDYIYKFKNCVEYDINGAHCDAIREIFPKAADEITKMYKERKIKPVYKKFFNYFVGMLGSSTKNNGRYIGTYIWIVQRTTKLLEKRIKAVGGRIIYINTDGFIVQNPENVIEHSKDLGNFKIEYQGTVYVGRTDNYMIKQIGDNLKGTGPLALRCYIHLDKGEMVEYNNRVDAVTRGEFRIVHKEIKNVK